jgi:hypothetical protein
VFVLLVKKPIMCYCGNCCGVIFKYVQDEHTFLTFIFMKDNIHNRLGPNLDTSIWMFAQKFDTHESFPYQDAITTWKDWKVWIGVLTWKV